MGYKVGHQRTAELHIFDYQNENWNPIIKYCKSAEAFQDVPFAYPYLYEILDETFSNSKFILTIRDSGEQWYNSLTKSHAIKFGLNNEIPRIEDLKKATYNYTGYMWDVNQTLYKTKEGENPYNKEKLIAHYHNHNDEVINYFKDKNNLIVINVKKSEDYKRLCHFLGKSPVREGFPWENKTTKI